MRAQAAVRDKRCSTRAQQDARVRVGRIREDFRAPHGNFVHRRDGDPRESSLPRAPNCPAAGERRERAGQASPSGELPSRWAGRGGAVHGMIRLGLSLRHGEWLRPF